MSSSDFPTLPGDDQQGRGFKGPGRRLGTNEGAQKTLEDDVDDGPAKNALMENTAAEKTKGNACLVYGNEKRRSVRSRARAEIQGNKKTSVRAAFKEERKHQAAIHTAFEKMQ